MRPALVALALLAAACTPAAREPLPEPPAAEETTTTTTAPPAGEPEGTTTTTTTLPGVGDVDAPETLARILTVAEETVRSPDASSDELERWGRTQQDAYRTLGGNPDWQPIVRDLIPEALRHAFDANLRAAGGLGELTALQEELPDWTILTPRPPEELLGYYRAAQEEFGVGWEYLAAIHLVETRMGRIRGNSPAGARGPMQFMPATWEAYGEGDVDDDRDAIRAAARYLAARGAPDDMAAALFAYNRSDYYVTAIEAYASVMREDPRAYHGYYHWQVYYRLASGTVLLPEGWSKE